MDLEAIAIIIRMKSKFEAMVAEHSMQVALVLLQ